MTVTSGRRKGCFDRPSNGAVSMQPPPLSMHRKTRNHESRLQRPSRSTVASCMQHVPQTKPHRELVAARTEPSGASGREPPSRSAEARWRVAQYSADCWKLQAQLGPPAVRRQSRRRSSHGRQRELKPQRYLRMNVPHQRGKAVRSSARRCQCLLDARTGHIMIAASSVGARWSPFTGKGRALKMRNILR